MKRTRGERRDLTLRKRRQRYNKLRKREGRRAYSTADSVNWRRAKSDDPWPRWANDPDDFWERRRRGEVTMDDFYTDWRFRSESQFGTWSDKERKSFEEAKEI